MRGQDHEAEIVITLEDAYFGATKTVTLQGHEVDLQGQLRPLRRNYEVRIPAGATDGTRLRIAGKGGEGMGGELRSGCDFPRSPNGCENVWSTPAYDPTRGRITFRHRAQRMHAG